MLKNVVNYDPKGRKVRDFLYDGGLVQGIFVDIVKSSDVPYVVTGRPFNRDDVSDMVSIEYVPMDGVVKRSKDVRLADILDYPEYDGNTMVGFAPFCCIVDYEKIRQIRLRGVGD